MFEKSEKGFLDRCKFHEQKFPANFFLEYFLCPLVREMATNNYLICVKKSRTPQS